MTMTIDTFSTTRVSPLDLNRRRGLAIKEVSGSDSNFVQDTGQLTDFYAYEMLLDDADHVSIKVLMDNATHKLTDDRVGITLQTVRIQSYGEKEEVPSTWRIKITMVKV